MPNPSAPGHPFITRRRIFLKYLVFTAVLNLVWEVLQLPLYTLWREDSLSAIAFAVVHCTLGDVLIAVFALVVAFVTDHYFSHQADEHLYSCYRYYHPFFQTVGKDVVADHWFLHPVVCFLCYHLAFQNDDCCFHFLSWNFCQPGQ